MLHTRGLKTLEDLRGFLAGSRGVEIRTPDREGAYSFLAQTLQRFGYKRLGKKKWRHKVHAVVEGFSAALLPDEIVVGGGQADRLKKLPPRTRRCDNSAAFLGGYRLWGDSAASGAAPHTYKDLS